MDAVLIAPVRQTLWGRLAVANFFLGGMGAGAWLVAVSLFGFAATFLTRLALALGALLVLAGFLSVAVEAGRPLRGPRVLRMAETSWMSRETWAGGAFIALAALDFLLSWVGWRLAASLAALFFVLAQGWVLRNCRGVPAWNVPVLPFVFLVSALVSGAGVLGLVLPLTSFPAESRPLQLGMVGLVLLSGVAWGLYLARHCGPEQHCVTDPAVLGIIGVGHLLPLGILLLTLDVSGFGPIAAALAGGAVLIGQLHAKACLILRAGVLRPITLNNLALRRQT